MTLDTGKQRSQRIQLNYYQKRDWWRYGFAIIAVVLAGLYGIYLALIGPGKHVSTGPVAEVHASFENDCHQCHQNFTPVGGSARFFDWGTFASHKRIARTKNACNECHNVGRHFPDLLTETGNLIEQDCATCHADHQGRKNDLAAVSDRMCVQCHGDLNKFCKDGISKNAEAWSSVTSFPGMHPAFRSLGDGTGDDDPGIVRFDHHQHMLPGQAPANDKSAFPFDRLPKWAKDKYGRGADIYQDLVQLECSDCHVRDGLPLETWSAPADRELGRYMAPVNFEKHCSACHELSMGVEDSIPVPHATPWSELDLLFASSIDGARAIGVAKRVNDDSQATPKVGEGRGAAVATLRSAWEADLVSIKNSLETQCTKCHDEVESIQDDTPTDSKPMIPRRWLRHGLFDHAAHEEFACRHCHAKAYRENYQDTPADDDKVVMIANRESCTDCHRDPYDEPAFNHGRWASNHCTTCHRFHDHTANDLPPEYTDVFTSGGSGATSERAEEMP